MYFVNSVSLVFPGISQVSLESASFPSNQSVFPQSVSFPFIQSVFPQSVSFPSNQSVFPLISQFSLSHSVFPRISQFSLKSVSSLDLTGMLFSYHEQFRYVDYVLHCINDYGTCISTNYLYRLLKKNLHCITFQY